MEELIIKHHKRFGRLSEFFKSSGKSLTLGRGFNNDVIYQTILFLRSKYDLITKMGNGN